MSLTPMDIHNKQFGTKMRGYDENEVDSFLDRIVDSFSDALDKNIDLENENNKLKKELNDLNKKLAEYDNLKESLNKSLISAQANAAKIKANADKEASKILTKANKEASEIMTNANKEASAKTKDLKQQYNTLSGDYELLKVKVADFRAETQKLLKDQLEQLDDNTWQYYLDQYFGRSRLYPADGKQPVIPDTEDNIENEQLKSDKQPELKINGESQSEIDNSPSNEVNSVQGLNENQPKILTGDSPSHEENTPKSAASAQDKGPMIVFPDDYKDHK